MERRRWFMKERRKKWFLFSPMMMMMMIFFCFLIYFVGDNLVLSQAQKITPAIRRQLRQQQHEERKQQKLQQQIEQRKEELEKKKDINKIRSKLKRREERENPKRTMVVYSGPTDRYDLDLFREKEERGRRRVYHDNFRFFLRTALLSEDLGEVDFLFFLTQEAMESYKNVIDYLTNLAPTQFRFLTRSDIICYDLDSFYHSLKQIDIPIYRDFIFLNCGIRGPFMPHPYRITHFPWPLFFTSLLDEEIKLVGLSINCEIHQMHVQSMLWATDRKGLAEILKNGCIYDCKSRGRDSKKYSSIIRSYELCLTKAMKSAGYLVYAVNSIQGPLFKNFALTTRNSPLNCTDYWWNASLPGGRNFHPFETVFFKVSRFMTDEVKYFTETHLKLYNPFPPGAIRNETILTDEGSPWYATRRSDEIGESNGSSISGFF